MENRFFESMNINFVCTKTWILQDVPHQIWEAQTSDWNSNTLITRFFHNKFLFYANNGLRCYLSYLSPDFIAAAFTIIGLALFITGLYFLVRRKKYPLLTILIAAPMSPLLSVPKQATNQAAIIYGAILSVILFGVFETITGLKILFRR